MPYPILLRSFNLGSTLRDFNAEDNLNLTESNVRTLLLLSFSPCSPNELIKAYKRYTGNIVTPQQVNDYVRPLEHKQYIIKQGKKYVITPSGLLILSRLEKRLKRIR